MNEADITIDLVTYKMRVYGTSAVIFDCEGSVLSKLEKPAGSCWTKFAGFLFDGRFFGVEYANGECYIDARNSLTTSDVVNLIDEKFDAIDSVGYEALDCYS
jgi:hypothetical protein